MHHVCDMSKDAADKNLMRAFGACHAMLNSQLADTFFSFFSSKLSPWSNVRLCVLLKGMMRIAYGSPHVGNL